MSREHDYNVDSDDKGSNGGVEEALLRERHAASDTSSDGEVGEAWEHHEATHADRAPEDPQFREDGQERYDPRLSLGVGEGRVGYCHVYGRELLGCTARRRGRAGGR